MARNPAPARDPRRATVAILLLVASSIVFMPGGFERWTLPKLAVAALAVAIALWAPAGGRIPRLALIVIGAFALVAAVAALAGVDPTGQLIGRWPRYDGLVAGSVAVLCFVAGARLFGPDAPATRWRTLALGLSVAAWLVGLLALLETVGLRPIPSDLDRPGSLLGQASAEGTWAVLTAALLGAYLLRRVLAGERWMRADDVVLAGTAAALVTVVLSASRIAIAATVVLALVAIVLLLTRRTATGRRLAIVVGAVLAVTVAAVALLPGTGSRFAGDAEAAGGPLADRWALWSASLRLVGDHPFLGVGPGAFGDAIAAYRDDGWTAVFGAGVTVDSAHDLLLDIAAAGGIPLLLIALTGLVLGVIAAVRGLRQDGRRLPAALAVAAALLCWTTGFPTSGTAPLVAALAGAVLAIAPTEGRRVPRIVGRGVAVVLAAALAAAAFGEVPLQTGVTSPDPAASASGFSAARVLRPWDPDLVLIESQVLTARAATGEGVDAALVAATAAVAARPGSVLAGKSLAAAQQFAGLLDEAADTLADLDRRAPDDAEILGRRGLVEAQRGDLAAARGFLERAVELDPDDPTSWQALGFVYQETGDEAGLRRVEEELARLGAG